MFGTILDAAAVVVGGVLGLSTKKDLSAENQAAIKVVLGLLIIYVGLSTAWGNLNGTLPHILKQVTIVIVALTLGRICGRLLRIQNGFNRLGKYATQKFSRVDATKAERFNEGFLACTVLFCVTPMAVLGCVEDGVFGKSKTLAVKAVLDGLATAALVRSLGWSVMLAVVPLFACQGTLTLIADWAARSLRDPQVLNAIGGTLGLLIFCLGLLIFNVKKIQVADYLPSLIIAPLISWLLR